MSENAPGSTAVIANPPPGFSAAGIPSVGHARLWRTELPATAPQPSAPGERPGFAPLSGSVGAGGANAASDVRTVQAMLAANGFWGEERTGQPSAALIEAIRAFQHSFNMRRPDGRVDAGFSTDSLLRSWARPPRPERIPERGSATARFSAGDQVVLMGDSLSVGLSTRLSALAERDGIELRAIGQSSSAAVHWTGEQRFALPAGDGEAPRVIDLPARLATALADSPDYVLISLGTNDEYRQDAANASAYRSEVRALLQQIIEAGAEPILIGAPTLDAVDARPNGFAARNALRAELGSAGFADNHFPSRQLRIERSPGDLHLLHPTGDGYRHWADAVWNHFTV